MDSSLNLICEQATGQKPARPIFLICVFKDERVLLEHFIRYYKSIGVSHFIMIDNNSTDEGPRFLKTIENTNITIYRTDENYERAAMGTDWVNHLLHERLTGQYCLTVDVDELLVFDNHRFPSLPHLIEEMERSGANAFPATLLDMYPKTSAERYSPGEDFLNHSRYFDDLNPEYYDDRGVIYGRFQHKVGGVRLRIFETLVCIHKFPIFKYDFYPLGVAPGYHFFQLGGSVLRTSDAIRLSNHSGVLLHFKFLKQNLGEFYRSRSGLGQNSRQATELSQKAMESWWRENRCYERVLSECECIEFYDPRYSRALSQNSDLAKFWIT